MQKRFIEESFPVKEVSEESTREKTIRSGNISSLHIWWARRPLSSSRSTNYASLIPAPKDEIDWVKKRNFIIELSKWENSYNMNIINKAKEDIISFNDGIPPKVLDPFSGGGAIPLEALRLGCDTYVNDYNPVAVLIEKCTLEFPIKNNDISSSWSEKDNPLLNDLKKWSNWIFEETKRELNQFYPHEVDGSDQISYVWARTLKCQNPNCGIKIPLMRQYWLAKKKNKNVALKPYFENNEVKFEIVGQNNEIPKNFDPSKGTISKAIVNCPKCNTTIDANTTRNLFQKGEYDYQLLVIVSYSKRTKFYRIADEKDVQIFNKSKNYLDNKRTSFIEQYGFDPVPEEPLPPIGTLGFRVQRYGLLKWGDLFNSRQKLALVSVLENLLKAHKFMKEEYDEEYANILLTYLSFSLDKLASWNSVLSPWLAYMESVHWIFSRQIFPMTWDYGERNPFVGKLLTVENISKTINNISKMISTPAKVTNGSATELPYPDNYFDAVFTDPPYYDNVPYSHLSDFFYVWLKRSVGHIYPELFLTPLTPKKNEIVAYSHLEGGIEGGKEFFETMLQKSFQEINRVLKKDGITTIVYAHKTSKGWETVINALLDSGLTVTASWPISTEMTSRLRAQRSAALASSMYIVARKFEKNDIGWFNDVKYKLKKYIPHKLDKLWEEGISGADFYVSAIGSAIEIFGQYKKVMDNKGNEIRADKILEFVRSLVTDYTVRQILHNGISSELSPLTKFYLLWRWNYGENRVSFDEARKLAQSSGIDLANEWNKGFIIKKGEFISIKGPGKRDIRSLEDSKELIDVLHHMCILWKEGKNDEQKYILKKSGLGEGEALYKVAQAISETLPNNSSEKKMIEGFLAGRDKIMQDMREDDDSQTKLV